MNAQTTDSGPLPEGEPGPSGSGPTESLTNLLKKHQVDLSAVKANKMLLQAGILEEKERPSTTQPGKMKRFKVLTEAGQRYGINKENLDRLETQPHYYQNTFEELAGRFLVVS